MTSAAPMTNLTPTGQTKILKLLIIYSRKAVRLQIDPIVNAMYNDPLTHSNDIAMLKLSEAVDLGAYTPACLPSFGTDFTGQKGIVCGRYSEPLMKKKCTYYM